MNLIICMNSLLDSLVPVANVLLPIGKHHSLSLSFLFGAICIAHCNSVWRICCIAKYACLKINVSPFENYSDLHVWQQWRVHLLIKRRLMMRKLLEQLLGTPLNSSFLNMSKTFLDKVVGTLLLSPSTRFQKQTLMCCLLTCEVHLQPLYLLVVCFVLVKAAIRCTTVLVQCKPYPG